MYQTTYMRSLGINFTKGLWALKWTLLRIFFHHSLIMNIQFCTCLDSAAVMACAKLWPDCLNIFHVRVMHIFTRFQWRAPENLCKMGLCYDWDQFSPNMHSVHPIEIAADARICQFLWGVRSKSGLCATLVIAMLCGILCHDVTLEHVIMGPDYVRNSFVSSWMNIFWRKSTGCMQRYMIIDLSFTKCSHWNQISEKILGIYLYLDFVCDIILELNVSCCSTICC